MRIRDLSEQMGERTSALFRASKLEPLKISVTPSVARDRISYSPDELETVYPALFERPNSLGSHK